MKFSERIPKVMNIFGLALSINIIIRLANTDAARWQGELKRSSVASCP